MDNNNNEKELMKAEENKALLATTNEEPILGFEDEEDEDLIIPRVKVIQALSPERKEKIADEGDILNSLTHDKLNGLKFIPVFMFKNNLLWKDRKDGGGIICQAKDGKNGITLETGECKLCKVCKLNEFDNSKVGAEAAPKCIKYMNFFGFVEGLNFPIILSFGKTNYNEGRKMYTTAKSMRQNMWNFAYTLTAKEVTKDGNNWFIIEAKQDANTSDEDRAFARSLYEAYHSTITDINFDVENAVGGSNDVVDTVETGDYADEM